MDTDPRPFLRANGRRVPGHRRFFQTPRGASDCGRRTRVHCVYQLKNHHITRQMSRRKNNKSRLATEENLAVARDAGRANFPVTALCKLLKIDIDDFSSCLEIQDEYRNAQLETELAIRKMLVDSILTTANPKLLTIFLKYYAGSILPDIRDMPEDDEQTQ